MATRLSRIRTELLFQGPSVEPGGLKMAGTIAHGTGTGRPKMRIFGSYALVYLLGGEGEFRDSLGNRRRIIPGNLIWVFPDIPHSYGPDPGGRWDELYLIFDGELFDLWRRHGLISPDDPVWKLAPLEFWFDRLDSLVRVASDAEKEPPFHHLGQFQALVAEMRAASHATAAASPPAWLAKACRALSGEEPVDFEALAASLGLSHQTFRKRFARKMGIPPNVYRQARRIDRACALLMDRSLSHKEIAERLGFCDEFHFGKAFRSRLGFSPRTFRRKALGIEN